MTAPRRHDGYAPIADYAVLGDGRTAALVATDGRVDWWPFPTLDAPPVVAAILDPERGGHFLLAPTDPYEARRRYIEGTNVLETTYASPKGTVKVTAGLNTGAAGRLPWTELAHRVDHVDGVVDLAWELIPGNRFGDANPWVTERHGTPVATIGDQTLAVVVGGADPGAVDGQGVHGQLTVGPGQRAVIGIVATDHEPLFLPLPAAIDDRLDRTIDSWRQWSSLLESDGPWDHAVRRSALALKTLVAEATGAIAAAATTSLPEGIGGTKNWDYRYSWVRDSSFTLDALINLGLHEEVHGAVSWLLDAVRRNGGALHVFYSLRGDRPGGETEIDLRGYRDSRPVRSGNSAAGQTQLGTYGDLFDTIHRYCEQGHLLDQDSGRMLADLADSCCDAWRRPDSGIWELDRTEHYTISKIGCWVALDRAARLADTGQLPDGRAERWRGEAEEVRRWVDTHCWSDAKQAYTFWAGSDDLDAAVLLAGRTGFERGPRLVATVDAVAAELGRGPLLYRYTGMEAEEGAFVACTFWMVEALVHTGQVDRARRLMEEAVELTNDVGLLAEQIDPATGAFLGNVPQGLSHLALVNAAFAVRRAST